LSGRLLLLEADKAEHRPTLGGTEGPEWAWLLSRRQHNFFLMLARSLPIMPYSGTERHFHASSALLLLADRKTSGRMKGVSMGSISLFNTVDNLYNTTQTTTDNTAQKTAATQPEATTSQDDSVKLSTAAQAKSLYKQGQSVSTIAASLGTDTKTVNSLLGISLQKAIEKTLETTLSAKA
jgi:hypothetical protein